MSELEDRFVKIGFWINREHGYIMGQTLTVQGRTGTVIVAFLTILASIAAAQLWNLFTFLYHQYRANSKPGDGLFWQHQALLRTMPTPTAFMADTLKLSWTWRTRIPRALLRCSLPFFISLCFAVAAIAAGISTAFAIDSSNIEVLIDSPLCGRFNYTKVFENRSSSTLIASIDGTVDTYATNCYRNNPSLPGLCHNTFTRPNISFSITPAACPWNETLCRSATLPAILMDSGLLDLSEHFGFNMASEDSVKLQKKTTCSVLPMQDRIVVREAAWWSARGFDDAKTTIEYGAYRNTDPILRPEATFLQSQALTERQQSYGSDGIISYSQKDSSSIGIIPIPEMHRIDADVDLGVIWLNSVMYEKPVNDPLFSAHKNWTYLPGGGYAGEPRYLSDNAAGVIACSTQYRFCVSQAGQEDFCTPLAGSPLDSFTKDFPHLRPVQRRLLQLLRSITRLAKVSDSAEAKSILAQRSVRGRSSPGLPDDQWIKEVTGWESRVWASYQALLAIAVVGPSVFDEYADEYTEPVVDEGDKQLCQSLKMRKSGGFANINVFALAFVVSFSLVITICNTLILRFFIFMTRFRAALAPRIDHWVQDGIFQLQRRAFEAQDQGRWENLEQEVPTTLQRENLHKLPVESSLVSKAADKRLAKMTKLRKVGTGTTVETVVEADEDEITPRNIVRRTTAGTDTMTLVGTDTMTLVGTDTMTLVGVDMEKNGLEKMKSGDAK
ncbi:hypothetical protein CC86DRAFT_468717 [Ophiobolus disseminans]|uniref:Uncharacterized protein n=1 Tax=Ophiobolus disseminans TaxID=1469910 RepID=A0A6A6ZTN3_9PLEO|nr:hypothetical protein CC86DRAFT_468717 [Ophiobolus disseminans]